MLDKIQLEALDVESKPLGIGGPNDLLIVRDADTGGFKQTKVGDLQSAGGSVTSVNGEKGDVVLDAAEVGAAPAVHTHTTSQVVGLDTTLANKANLSGNKIVIPNYTNGPIIGLIKNQGSSSTDAATWITSLSDTDPAHKGIGVSQAKGPIYWDGTTERKIYNEANKPTPADISAHEVKPWIASPGMDANDAGNYTAFTYANNAPHIGPLVSMGISGYTMQFNGTYVGAQPLSFRTHNGDNSTWNPWQTIYTTSNKPTPADIGALPSAGGTITGPLNVNGVLTGLSMISGYGTGNTFGNAGLEARAGATTDPSISFHKVGSYAATMRLTGNSQFGLFNQDNSNHASLNLQNLYAAGNVSGASIGVNQTDGVTGAGISLYGGATGSSKPAYGMFFGATATWGKHGSISGDWATYLTMEGASDRGWIFRRSHESVASISSSGHAFFNASLTANNLIISDATNSSWWRTTGEGGWYNTTYGGGLHMSDATWLRTYGGKKFFVDNQSGDAIFTSGGVRALGNIEGDGYLRSTKIVYGGEFRGTNNVTGTGEAVYCPAGVYSTGHNWLEGSITTSNHPINTGTGYISCGNLTSSGAITGTTVTGTSDKRKKTSITTLENSLEKVCQLRGVSYNWKDSGVADVGVIAQEVRKVVPEVVHEGEEGILSVDHGHLIGHLIEAIKTLEKRVKELEER